MKNPKLIQNTICLLCAVIGLVIGGQVGELHDANFFIASLAGLVVGGGLYFLVRLDCWGSIDALEYASNQ
jgi:hypothetical protein